VSTYLLSIVGNWVIFYVLLQYNYGVTRGDAFWMVVLSSFPIAGTLYFIAQLEDLTHKSTFFIAPLRLAGRPSGYKRKLKVCD
jgi:hypothetical protein